MIDVKTGFLLWSVEALTLSAILAVAWAHKRSSAAYLWWSAALAAQGIGVALVAARGHIPDFLSIEFANALALSGYAFAIAGLRLKDRRPAVAASLLPVTIWVAAMFVPGIRENLGHRSIVFAAASAAGSLVMAGCLWQPGFATLRTRRRLAGVFLAQAAMQVVATILLARSAAQTLQQLANIPATTLSAAIFVVLIVLFACKMVMEDLEERMKDLARLDSLTGVLNRRGFFDRFEEIRRGAESAGLRLALILFDLDHFKQVNDRFGHAAGDKALTAFSRIAHQRTGEKGAFARLGGEEFAALLPVEDVEQACIFAEDIRRALEVAPVIDGAHRIPVTVSAGVHAAAAAATDLDLMLPVADRALYAAKHEGRNRYAVASQDGDGEQVLDGRLEQLRALLTDNRPPSPCGRFPSRQHG